MRYFRSAVPLVHIAVGVFIAIVVLRTWVVMGLVVPLEVSASSMAPALLGPHCSALCPDCGHATDVAADSVPDDHTATCARCGNPGAKILGPLQRGDPLWVNRLVQPARWGPAIFRNPHEGGALCVKRIVGLPGETVSIDGGDILVDGRFVHKSLQQQRAVRVPVACREEHRDGGITLRPTGSVFTDDLPYNAALSRRLNPVTDLLLSVRVCLAEESTLHMEIGKTGFAINASHRAARITVDENVLAESGSPQIAKMLGREVLVEASTFDHRVLLAVDSIPLLEAPFIERREVSLVSASADRGTRLRDVRLFRDVYYEHRPGDEPGPWRLAADHVFVLGDNSPVSIDSRHWGPIDANYILGKPLGVR